MCLKDIKAAAQQDSGPFNEAVFSLLLSVRLWRELLLVLESLPTLSLGSTRSLSIRRADLPSRGQFGSLQSGSSRAAKGVFAAFCMGKC